MTRMRTTMLNWEKTLLIVLLLTTYLFTFVVGNTKLCRSRNGRSRRVCNENDSCCTDNFGRASCCSINLSGGAIAGIVVGSIVAPFVLSLIVFLCACIYHKHKVSTTGYSATTTTRRVVTTSGQTTIPQPPVRETRSVEIETPNQPPSSHSDSNTNNLDLPPPYPSNNHPPLYSEINI